MIRNKGTVKVKKSGTIKLSQGTSDQCDQGDQCDQAALKTVGLLEAITVRSSFEEG